MIKSISPKDVCLGMYIQGFDGAWLDHPFWRTSFQLEKESDLAAIVESEVRGVLIDLTKGVDVGPRPLPAAIPSATQGAPLVHGRDLVNHIADLERLSASSEPCSASEELDRAEAVLVASKAVISRLFCEFRERGNIRQEDATPVADAIRASVARNSSAMISVARLRTKDEYTFVHSIAVSALMVNLGRQRGLEGEVLEQLSLAGLLHDIGKLAVPAKLLNKPDRLTDDEFKVVRNHPERGYEVLKNSGSFSDIVLDVCLHHHERVDGSGYPHGLTRHQISDYAKMAAVCDVYDAITSRRSYKLAWLPSESVRSMYKWSGHFDQEILAAFIRSIGIYPVGSLVRLQSGRLAVVADHNKFDLTKPVVRLICPTTAGECHQSYSDQDPTLLDDPIASREDPKVCGFQSYDTEWRQFISREAPLTLAATAAVG
jgi:HD-GYP domain-containing protein (c-di-GMP phosphodiesterase class II)